MVFFWFGLRTQFFWHQNYPATGFCSRYPQAMQVRCQVCAFCCWPGTRANGHMTRMIIHQWIRPGFRHLHVWTSAGQFDPHSKEFAARNRLNRLDRGEEVVWKQYLKYLPLRSSEVAHFQDGYLAAPLGNSLSTSELWVDESGSFVSEAPIVHR